MKIGVISDSHGDLRSLECAATLAPAVEMWLHAGDLSQDGRFLAEHTGVPVVAVDGNCDGRGSAKPDEFVDCGSCRIWLTHGHRYNIRDNNAELVFWANRYEVQAVVFGHSHIPYIQWEQDLLLFNPGSASRPRGGSAASFGILEITQSGLIIPEIIPL